MDAKKSGIYKIENLVNGYNYIGSAKNLSNRWGNHRRDLIRGIHTNKHLQNAWKLYGQNNFRFVVIEECEVHNLLEREQFFIDTVKPEYNICAIAGNSTGIKHTDAARRNMSIAHKNQISWNKGKKLSEETKAKMSIAHKGKPPSLATRQAVSLANRGKIAWNRGKKTPENTRKKLSISLVGHKISEETRRKISASLMGHTVTTITRKKLSINHKGGRLSHVACLPRPAD